MDGRRFATSASAIGLAGTGGLHVVNVDRLGVAPPVTCGTRVVETSHGHVQVRLTRNAFRERACALAADGLAGGWGGTEPGCRPFRSAAVAGRYGIIRYSLGWHYEGTLLVAGAAGGTAPDGQETALIRVS